MGWGARRAAPESVCRPPGLVGRLLAVLPGSLRIARFGSLPMRRDGSLCAAAGTVAASSSGAGVGPRRKPSAMEPSAASPAAHQSAISSAGVPEPTGRSRISVHSQSCGPTCELAAAMPGASKVPAASLPTARLRCSWAAGAPLVSSVRFPSVSSAAPRVRAAISSRNAASTGFASSTAKRADVRPSVIATPAAIAASGPESNPEDWPLLRAAAIKPEKSKAEARGPTRTSGVSPAATPETGNSRRIALHHASLEKPSLRVAASTTPSCARRTGFEAPETARPSITASWA